MTIDKAIARAMGQFDGEILLSGSHGDQDQIS